MRKLRLLHTEASNGWGGQEIRIIRESQALIERGHDVAIAAAPGAQIIPRAKELGIATYTVPFERRLGNLQQIRQLLKQYNPSLLITHSSLDSWMGGIAAKSCRTPVVRMRHLSASIRPGLNSKALYRWLANGVVTTCEEVAGKIRDQAHIGPERCQSIPTGIDPEKIQVSNEEVQQFKDSCGFHPSDFIAGSCCVLRSWKGIDTLLNAAHLMRNVPHLRWLVVGDGPHAVHYRQQALDLELGNKVLFTGQLENPLPAMAAMDIFLLLSKANEGVSQASMQAASLKKPLITTRVGGLHEICRDDQTGITVDTGDAQQVADAVTVLMEQQEARLQFGEQSRELVASEYNWNNCLDRVESFYQTYSR